MAKQSAGLLLCARDANAQWVFLLQQTFEGRKQGYLMDLGGACQPGESLQHAAAREFWEEGGKAQFSMETLEIMINHHRETYMDRKKKKKGSLYRLFVVECNWFDLDAMNKHREPGKKRRAFFWIPHKQLLKAWKLSKRDKLPSKTVPPNRVWKRLRLMPLKKTLEVFEAK